MTPLAHRIVKELTLPMKRRTFNGRGGLLKKHRFYDVWLAAIGRADFADAAEAKDVYHKAKGLFAGHVYA
jgi:hypothetical protein